MANEDIQTQGEDLGDLSGFRVAEEGFNVRNRRKPKGLEDPEELAITSLMDILTILLVFLLKSFSTNPAQVPLGDELELPDSTSLLQVEEAIPVLITKTNVIVGDEAVVNLVDGKIDAADKRDGSYYVTRLYDALSAEATKQKKIAELNRSQSFDGLAFIVADSNTQFRTLNEVLYTAGQAQFGKFKFAVIKQ